MPVLKKGSSGAKVLSLQKRLKELGFDPKGVDGKFGPGTLAAVIAFQKANGLEPDGMVGPNTLGALDPNKNAGGSTPVEDTTTPPDTNGSGLPAIPGAKLTEEDYGQAAKMLNCEVAAIKAVAEVESRGSGFMPDGRPTILYERHKFHEFTKGAFSAAHRGISSASPGNYGPAGKHQWDRFNEASALNQIAAIKSCSWGKFQLMGFNFKICGFKTLDDFHTAMLKSEGEQLRGFCNFIIASGLDKPLRNHNWAAFAKGYNGKNYKINKYDTKLAAAYKKYSKK